MSYKDWYLIDTTIEKENEKSSDLTKNGIWFWNNTEYNFTSERDYTQINKNNKGIFTYNFLFDLQYR